MVIINYLSEVFNGQVCSILIGTVYTCMSEVNLIAIWNELHVPYKETGKLVISDGLIVS